MTVMISATRRVAIVDGQEMPIANIPVPVPSAGEVLAAERARMVCSRFQAKAAMLGAGLLASVETLIGNSDAITQLAWAEAVEFRRNSVMVTTLAAALEMTDAQLDDLFRAAMAISV